MKKWTEADFDSLSWHDCAVYGFKLENFIEEEGSSNLILDLDFIVDCEETETGLIFIAQKAEICFHKVFGLIMNLNYDSPSAGMCPFSINEIKREKKIFPSGYSSYQWQIDINWPQGSIEFQAPHFTQIVTGDSYIAGDRK